MKIIITGFEPFNQLKTNPSQQLVEKLIQEKFPFQLLGVVLPVSFEHAFPKLRDIILKEKPDYVICTGLATDRDHLTIERMAINIMDADISDNDGVQPQNQKIVPKGPDGLFSNLPILELKKACLETNMKTSISNSAGTYVCNHVMYQLMMLAKEKGFRGGFIHIPPESKMSLSKVFHGFIKLLNHLV